ncbi:FecCD family ABC transporter permease [Rothia kristinae]|uniref:FecCD family ABC transporter permease n=1 Tax=Rothia kristinae TaxID=37923 RepID=UPI0018C90742
MFQTLSRNPLGSPDILGFTTGSATGALIVSLVLPGMRSGEAGAEAGGLGIGVGAVLGGFLTAAVVLLLARREASVGSRLILAGIAIAALLSSVNDYLLTSADLEEAESAKTWLYGSLNALRWPDLTGPGPAILLLLFALLLGRRQLRMLELGEDMAGGLGVPVRRTSRVLMMLAVGITAAAIAVAGPIGFLALAAPQLAHRWWRTAGLTVGTSALLGAGILAVADFLAARLLSPFEIPVGLVTGALGGVYLLWLLHRERERL